MALNLINLGNFANDGTGDDLREAFIKVNQNFEDLDLRNDEKTTASNIGDAGTGADVFKQRVGYDLQFRRIKPAPGQRITIEQQDENIAIDAVGSEWRFVTNAGTDLIEDSLASQVVHLKGVPYPDAIAPGVDQVYVSYNGDSGEIEFRINPKLKADTTPTLGGNLNANNHDITNGGTVTASQFNGPLAGNVYGIDIRTFNILLEELNFDFGSMTGNASRLLDWVVQSTNVDFGTITSPDGRTLDFGSII
jgi:hypothetical protein